MDRTTLLDEIRQNVAAVAQQSTALARSLWDRFIKLHPADMADFFADVARDEFRALFIALPQALKLSVFKELPDSLKVHILNQLDEENRLAILHALQADELTDLFDFFSDEELRSSLNLLNKTAREGVLSLMKFHPESAGGIMDPQVFSLMEDFTVENSVSILQRLRPDKDIYQRVYVTDDAHRLVGYIDLQDLVLRAPGDRISQFMKKNELVIQADQDQEQVAQQMVHYGLMNVPVISDDGTFLGVIPADTLADVLVEEAGEDVQRISAMPPLKQTYFETPFAKLLFERSGILVVLLIAESFSGFILHEFEATLSKVLLFFIPMLISTGGNTSSQTSAIAIQGMAAGEIRASNVWRFLKRELMLGGAIGLILVLAGFTRVFMVTHKVKDGLAISLTLGLIVMLSVTLGSGVPLLLRRLKIDPALSAGPFLATVMDILGVLIYCYLVMLILY